MICGSGGWKSRLAKAAGAEPSGQMRDEKLHTVVARSKFRSQNVQNTPGPDHFRKLICRKSARRCGAKHISKSTCTKHHMFAPLLEVEMLKKCTPLWREAHFEVKSAKNWRARSTFGRSDVVCVVGRRDCAPCQKWAKSEGFVAFPKTMAGVGHWKRIFKDAFRVAGAVQKTCSSEMLGGQGADFLRRVAFWSIRCVGLLRWFCVTGAALRMACLQFFVAGEVVKTGGVKKSQKSRFLKEVSQNCFVLDVVNFEKWRSLAELLRFGCCQVQKLRKSRRIASFLMLSTLKSEEVLQNGLVFKLADRQVDRQTDRQTDRQRERERERDR